MFVSYKGTDVGGGDKTLGTRLTFSHLVCRDVIIVVICYTSSNSDLDHTIAVEQPFFYSTVKWRAMGKFFTLYHINHVRVSINVYEANFAMLFL